MELTNIIITAIVSLITGTGIGYFLFFRQKKQQHQAEADKSTHEATKEGVSAELHEVQVRQEIRAMFDKELSARLKQVFVLRGELAREHEEKLSERRKAAKLEKTIEQLNERFAKFENCFCGNPICQKPKFNEKIS
jgi:flagellar basal body-associated protein FliL